MSESNSSYPTVATIIGCPEELSSASDLVATPIGITGELQPPSVPNSQQSLPPDTSDIKDPVKKAVIDNIWGKLPTKNPIEKLRCDLCNVECVGQTVFTTHLSGSKHLKKVKEMEMKKEYARIPHVEYNEESSTYTCRLCNATLNASCQIAAHLSGTKHRNKLQSKKQLVENIAEINNDPVRQQRVDATPNLLYCAACNIHVNSTMQLDQHTASRKHVNKVNGNRNKVRQVPYFKRGWSQRGNRGGGISVSGTGGRFLQNSNQNFFEKDYHDHFTSGGQLYT